MEARRTRRARSRGTPHELLPRNPTPARGEGEKEPLASQRPGSCGPPDLVLVRKFHLEAAARNCSRRPRPDLPPWPPGEPGRECRLSPPPRPRGNAGGEGDSQQEMGRMEEGRTGLVQGRPSTPGRISAMNSNFLSIMNIITS